MCALLNKAVAKKERSRPGRKENGLCPVHDVRLDAHSQILSGWQQLASSTRKNGHGAPVARSHVGK